MRERKVKERSSERRECVPLWSTSVCLLTVLAVEVFFTIMRFVYSDFEMCVSPRLNNSKKEKCCVISVDLVLDRGARLMITLPDFFFRRPVFLFAFSLLLGAHPDRFSPASSFANFFPCRTRQRRTTKTNDSAVCTFLSVCGVTAPDRQPWFSLSFFGAACR